VAAFSKIERIGTSPPDSAVSAVSNFPSQPLPKDKFPSAGADPDVAYQLVHDQLLLDGNSRQNLATFCQTWVEPQVHKLMDECLDKNMVDRDEYPQMAEIEARCVRMLADLWNSPNAAKSIGCSTIGSSEAATLAGIAMKIRWQRKRQMQRKSVARPNLICGPVHVCWQKFAKFFDVELRQIPCEGNRLMMSAEEVTKRCDENTIGVVPTLGLTYTLRYEPVGSVATALDDLEEQHGLNIPLHIDAASGGFVAPFIQPDVRWDFRIPRVKSINTSGHKFGLSPLGCGWIIWREPQDLPEEIVFRVKYLGGNMPTIALNFSRPGGQVVSQYYNFVRLGREGYRKVTEECVEVGRWFAAQVGEMGAFEVIYDGRGGLPGCCWTLAREARSQFSLYDIADRLRVRGWQVPAYPMPANRKDLVIQRVLARFGLSRDLAGLLAEDMRRAVAHIRKHSSGKPLTHQEASGYHHG
jgi:glutamate decarboxylase